MKKVYLLSLIACFVLVEACQPELWKVNQEPQSITLTLGDSTVALNITDESVKAEAEKTYTWLRNGQVITQRGGYAGKLLDGPYKVFDSQDRLKIQGEFLLGMRNGTWSFWRDGKLVEQVGYRQGELDGAYRQYVNERLMESGRHKAGYLDGKRTLYAVTDTSNLVITYKSGIPVDTLTTSR